MTVVFFAFTSPPSFFCWAVSMSLAFFASLVSGWYFLSNLKRVAAWFLSTVLLNWLMAGGIFSRKSMIFFIRCRRTYFGQRTASSRISAGWLLRDGSSWESSRTMDSFWLPSFSQQAAHWRPFSYQRLPWPPCPLFQACGADRRGPTTMLR